MHTSIRNPLRIALAATALAAALIAVLLSPLSPFSSTPEAGAFTLGAPSDIPNNSGQTLTIANEDVQLTFVSVSAGFNNEFGRALPPPTTSYFFCSSVPAGFTMDGGRFSGPQELRFYLTTPPQGSPSVPQTWYTGPGANNSDGFAHARMTQINATTVRLEWEDLINGGDMDFNDCVIDIMITPLATIRICEDVVPDDGGLTSWDFTIDGPDPDSDRNVVGIKDTGCRTEELLSPGPYTITETTQPPGYTTSVFCSNGANSPTNKVSFNLAGGQSVTCTYRNTLTSSITVCKDVVPDDGGATLWNFSIVGPSGSNINGLTDGNCALRSGLIGGSYTITETTQPPTHLTSVSCDQGNGANATNKITFTLSPGEQTTCTFRNQTVADIDVLKDFVPDSAANVTINLPVCTSGTPSSSDNTASEADAADFQVLGFSPGTTCDISEVVPAGYYDDQSDCQAVPITAGATSSCTMVNYEFASIEICKDVVPDDNAFTYDISLNGPTPHNTSLADGGCDSWSDLVAGSYTLLEAVVAGYQPSIDCGAFGVVSPGALLAIDIAPGDDVQCTVTNTFTPGPPAVGGIAGLLDPDGVPPLEEPTGTASGAWLLGGLAAIVALIVTAAGAGYAGLRSRR